ncbi:MAG: acetate/propionate family kinase [Vulcanococcus sp.]
MGVLVLNVGSSSLKAALLSGAAEQRPDQRLWQGQVTLAGPQALGEQLEQWLEPALGPWWPRISGVGHRVVHGGERFRAPTRLTAAVLTELEALSPLAPLHNPPALAAIHWLRARRPELPQWACFDTAFHADLAPAAYSYALPAAWRAGGCRRYGFHGLSHQHLAEAAARHWRTVGGRGQPRLISCHLGAGCSLAAVQQGRSIDTSMGFTPLEGLVMAQRSGSVDPGLVLHLQRHGLSLEELEQGLNQASGLRGLSGLSGDWLELRQAAAAGHPGASLALAVFRHRLLAGIGAMAASLGGVDMIGLTGGIGSHDRELLADLQQALAWLGPLQWLQVDADEEAMIARLIQQAGGIRANGSAGVNGISGLADPVSDAAGG